jgi:type II secretory pathway pseudopilin PulG
MTYFEIISVIILALTALIAVYGWLRDRRKDAEEDGALKNSIENLRASMDGGFKSVYHRIDDIKENITTCRREETERINRLEDRMDRTAGSALERTRT